MAKGGKVDSAAMERAEAAKNQLVSQYLHLGSAMKRCSVAVEAYATALNDATSNQEILSLLRAPVAGPMPTGMPEMMPFLTAGGAEQEGTASKGKGGNSKKRANSDVSDEVEVDENGKKKRKSKKKPVDPDAPKRPPSAYILFQNDIRAQMRQENPDIPYQEILTKTGTAWKELSEEKQKPYKEAAQLAMASYKADAAEYAANGKPLPDAANGDISMVDELAATPAPTTANDKKPKKEKKEKAATAAAAAKAGKPVSESKEPAAAGKKDKKPVATATPAAASTSSKPAVTSTPAAKNAPAPKPVSASTKKNVPQAAAESSSSEEDEDEEEEESGSSSGEESD